MKNLTMIAVLIISSLAACNEVMTEQTAPVVKDSAKVDSVKIDSVLTFKIVKTDSAVKK